MRQARVAVSDRAKFFIILSQALGLPPSRIFHMKLVNLRRTWKFVPLYLLTFYIHLRISASTVDTEWWPILPDIDSLVPYL